MTGKNPWHAPGFVPSAVQHSAHAEWTEPLTLKYRKVCIHTISNTHSLLLGEGVMSKAASAQLDPNSIDRQGLQRLTVELQSGLFMGDALLLGAVCCIMQLCSSNQGLYLNCSLLPTVVWNHTLLNCREQISMSYNTVHSMYYSSVSAPACQPLCNTHCSVMYRSQLSA